MRWRSGGRRASAPVCVKGPLTPHGMIYHGLRVVDSQGDSASVEMQGPGQPGRIDDAGGELGKLGNPKSDVTPFWIELPRLDHGLKMRRVPAAQAGCR